MIDISSVRHQRTLCVALVTTALTLFSLSPIAAEIVTQLPGAASDMVLDPARGMIYVSVPSQNAVVRVSANTYQILDTIYVGDAPMGLELSLDGTTLFAALNTSGSVGLYDLDNDTLQNVDVELELGDPRTFDVSQPLRDRIFVSAGPGSNGLAWIVAVDLVPGFPHQRVASNTIIRCEPTFEGTHDQSFLYVGACFSPNSLYKLDLSLPDAPIVLEDQHGSVSGATQLEVGNDLSRIFLGSGQVLDTSDFTQIADVESGLPRFADDNDNEIYLLQGAAESVAVYDAATVQLIETIPLACPSIDVKQFFVLDNFAGFVALGDDQLCVKNEDPLYLMDSLVLAEATVSFVGPSQDSFRAIWAYDLAGDSDGLDLENEGVRLTLGSYSENLPAGSFRCGPPGCNYRSPGPGLTNVDIANGLIVAKASGISLDGSTNAIHSLVELGNDFGEVPTFLTGKLKAFLPPKK